LHEAPHQTPVGRLDVVRAARQPDLRWRAPGKDAPASSDGATDGAAAPAGESAGEARREAAVQGRI
jgi:hypothetical protein